MKIIEAKKIVKEGVDIGIIQAVDDKGNLVFVPQTEENADYLKLIVESRLGRLQISERRLDSRWRDIPDAPIDVNP